MLILFVASNAGSGTDTAPELPDLHIQDSQSGDHIPVGGIQGWDNDYLQAQTVCKAPMVFQAEEIGKNAGDDSSMYWCRRLSNGLVKVNFTDSGANAVIYPLYEDKNGVKSIGSAITVNAKSRQDGALYMAEMLVFDLLGANKFGIYIESISVGTINVMLAGV